MSDELSTEEQPAKVMLTPAIERSLSALTLEQTDQGARDLALLYAQLIDDPKAAEKYTKALRLVSEAVSSFADDLPITAGDQMRTAWDRISSALAEHTVVSDLGPKLLATLTALGMTPAGRAAKSAPAPPPANGAVAKPAPILTELEKARNRARQRNAGA